MVACGCLCCCHPNPDTKSPQPAHPLLQECVFNPKLQAKQLVKEGKALKLAATLSTSHRVQVGASWQLS